MKYRTNVSIDKELFESARSKKLILSAILEKAIKEELYKIEEQEWVKENKAAAEEYGRFISKNGVFSDGARTF